MNAYVTRSQADSADFGAALGAHLRPGDAVLLRGELGAGKSVLARGIARALGVEGPMPSPTFTLMQPYRGRIPCYHFDLYRLDDLDDYYEAGLDEYVGGDGVALIEWPMEGLECGPRLEIGIARGKDGDERVLKLRCAGLDGREEALRAALKPWADEREKGAMA